MLAWFVVIALLGIHGIVRAPGVLSALSPLYAFDFLVHQNFHISFAILGAAFLAVTGGEAMYADMGHFGRVPIRLAWFAVALPGLVLNYFGQAALLITDASALDNPFYQLAPDWAHYPLVAFATVATVIVVEGLAFSTLRPAEIVVAVSAGRVAAVLACRRGLPAAPASVLGAGVVGSQPAPVAAAWIIALLAASSVAGGRPWHGPVAVLVALTLSTLLVRHCVRRFGGVNGGITCVFKRSPSSVSAGVRTARETAAHTD